jgi:hypothetical protein
MTFFDFLNVYKDKLILLAVILLQIVSANGWLVIPPGVLTTISALAAGSAIAASPHSTAAGVRVAAKRMGMYYTPTGLINQAPGNGKGTT